MGGCVGTEVSFPQFWGKFQVFAAGVRKSWEQKRKEMDAECDGSEGG